MPSLSETLIPVCNPISRIEIERENVLVLEQGFCSKKRGLLGKFSDMTLMLKHGKQIPDSTSLNPAFGISHFEFWMYHTFPIYFLLDIYRIGKSYHSSQGRGREVAVFTGDLGSDEN